MHTTLNAAHGSTLRLLGVILGISAFLFTSLAIIGRDAYTYHSILGGEYKTPWFSEKWWENPYTSARLQFYPATEYWTENAIRSERWLVREHDVNGTKFWTTLKRIPI